ncbi:MAG: chromosomal replication initiator protein DnaA [Ruminococcus sp.]|nr:chromosomal replication initiator protein DnaA [Ruminococcus sp.]MBO5382991.1 chromosomal replication initiator protein DnaA [Ruminococcus sp.]
MNSFSEVFEEVKRFCIESGKVGEVPLKTWIGSLEPVELSGQNAVFKVQSEFQKTIISNNYEDVLKEAFNSILGFDVNITINVVSNLADVKILTYDELEEKHAELEKSYEFAEYDYTFDTFIEGRSNEFALAACKAVAKKSSSDYNPLFIYGPSGLGKTHLITAIANEIRKNNPDENIVYVTSEVFGSELINAINNKGINDFHEKYRNADILLIDDIQFFAHKERMQEEFFHTFYKLHSEGKQIVITSDKPPKELVTLEERLRTRFEGGLIADISAPDFETRIAIIRRKAELLDLNIPSEVAEFIANRLKSNIRQLEGAVKKLKALKHLAGSPPSISMAQSVIRDILTDDQPIPITVEKIIAEVSTVYGVSPEDIRSNKRSSQISNARKVAIYVVREITQMPLASIGTEFGGRDHSTIVYAVNNVANSIKKDSNLNNLVSDIIKNIKDKSKV